MSARFFAPSAGGGHLDQAQAGVLQLVAGVAVAAPVGVRPLHEHAPLLREPVVDQVDVEVASSLGPGRAMFSKSTSTARELSRSAMGPPESVWGRQSGGGSSGVMPNPARTQASRWYQGQPPRGQPRRPVVTRSAGNLRTRTVRQPRQGSCMTTQQLTATTASRLRRRDPDHHRQPDGHQLRAPDRGWNHPRHRSSPDQGIRRRLRPHDL